MATKAYKFTLEDGCEYETRMTESGALTIRSESGKVVFSCGPYLTKDVLEILDDLRDEVKATDRTYVNPIVGKQEDERMFQLDERELMKVFRDCADTFIEKYLPNIPPEDEKTMVKLLDLFSNYAYSKIIEADIEKLDGMAEVKK